MIVHSSRSFALLIVACLAGTFAGAKAQTQPSQTQAQSSRPNIVIIWGDDIGQTSEAMARRE